LASNNSSDKSENTVAARAALLDFYGDQTALFASQFVASIFGLVTISAVILTLSQSLSVNPNWYLVGVFVILSLTLYLFFSYAAQYTYRRFTLYASLASHLVVVKNGLLAEAKLDKLETYYKKEAYEKDKEKINKVCEYLESHLPEGTSLCRENWEGEILKGAWINSRVYLEVVTREQNRAFIKKITIHARLTRCLMFLFLTILALITYFPLIISVLKVIFP